METTLPRSPALIIEYIDPAEGFRGWLVRDTLCNRLCAGGVRVQPGLNLGQITQLAHNMTLKMKISELRVDGAKCGIDYNPAAPGKKAALTRFMSAIRPYVECCYSMGPDLNVEMSELEDIATDIGLPSVKMAIARAQGWDLHYFTERSAILHHNWHGWSIGRLRAGYGVSAAALAVLDFLDIEPRRATVAVQGFGTLAKAALFGLERSGVKIVSIADSEKCISSTGTQGLQIKKLLTTKGPLLPDPSGEERDLVAAREAVFNTECDILIPAAVENSLTPSIASHLQVKAVVPGANLAVTSEAEVLLHQRGILVLPDFLAGCGGSISMEGLYGPTSHPEPSAVLDHVQTRIGELTLKVLNRASDERTSPRQAALRLCSETPSTPDSRPYGAPA